MASNRHMAVAAERPLDGTDTQSTPGTPLSDIELGWDGAARDHVTGALDELVEVATADVDADTARTVLARKQQEVVIETVREAEALRAVVTACQRRRNFEQQHAQVLGSLGRIAVRLDEELARQGYDARLVDERAFIPRFAGYVPTHPRR